MLRNSGDETLIICEAVTNDDHTFGRDFILADILAMVAPAHLDNDHDLAKLAVDAYVPRPVRLHYHQIANVLKWLVLVLFAYPVTAFVAGADWSRVLRATLVPTMPHSRDEWSTLVAILGTTISPYLFFWQASEEVEEEKAAGQSTLAQRRGATLKELELRNIDVGVGAFFSNMVMFFIILTTAITLNRHGITHIETTRQAAEALRPLAGKFAATLFTIGIVGVGFLAIPTLAVLPQRNRRKRRLRILVPHSSHAFPLDATVLVYKTINSDQLYQTRSLILEIPRFLQLRGLR